MESHTSADIGIATNHPLVFRTLRHEILAKMDARVFLHRGLQEADVLILDCPVRTPNWPHEVRAMAFAHPRARVLVASDSAEGDLCVELLRLGAFGLLGYADLRETLVPAIKALLRGETWLSLKTARTLRRPLVPATAGRGAELSRRESQVFELLRRRMSNKEIAALLGIGEATVKSHVSALLTKTHVTRRTDLFAELMAQG